jgi:hypothetical protein
MRYRLVSSALVPIALLAGAALAPLAAQSPSLDVELNKIEDNAGRCSAAFVLKNQTGETIDQLRLDLYVFDKAGVIARHLFLDTGPLRDGKTSVASFAILDKSCTEVGRLLVSDVPVCKTHSGKEVDCVAALNLTSKASVELAK